MSETSSNTFCSINTCKMDRENEKELVLWYMGNVYHIYLCNRKQEEREEKLLAQIICF